MTVEEFKNRVIPWSVKLYPVIFRILKNEDETRDALQELMIKLWSKRTDLLKCSNLPAYIIATARNHCFDLIKRKKLLNSNEPVDKRLFNVAADEPDPEKIEKLEHVHRIIENLPVKYKTVIQLRDIDGFEFDEISEFTGLEITHIRVILSRARLKVREEIEKLYEYEERRINR